jgi:hypothetical protein
MREHSGSKSSNNNLDPTLKDAEKAKGVSGEAELKDRSKQGQSRRTPES